MKIAVAANEEGQGLKETVINFLQSIENDCQIEDLSNKSIYEATINVVDAINNKEVDRGIIIDDYAVAPFMIANKKHGIICASVYEDYTSKMTRAHNSTQIICLGARITADALACEMVSNFVNSQYAGGRHQIRVDMLNKML